jgi:flagellar hook-basal body complex protein FliE
MTSPLPGIGSVTASPLTTLGVAPTSAAGTEGTTAATGSDPAGFADLLSSGVEKLRTTQANADTLAVQAATGQLTDVHDYTIAAAEAQLATQLTVAVRNKAIEAFTEIMRMPA